MIDSSDVAMALNEQIERVLLRRQRPACIRLGDREYRHLIDQSCSHRITVAGQDLPIFEAYQRNHPEAVPLYHVAVDHAGTPSRERYPATTGRALRHMRCLKRAYGISHYDGVPVERIAAYSHLHVVGEDW